MHFCIERQVENCTFAFPSRNAKTHNPAMSLRDTLKALMRKTLIDGRPISGKKLAELTDTDQPTIHRVLSGKVVQPRGEFIQKIAAFFGVTPAQLRGEEPLDAPSASESHIAELTAAYQPPVTDRQRYWIDAIEGLTPSQQGLVEALIAELQVDRRLDDAQPPKPDRRQQQRRASHPVYGPIQETLTKHEVPTDIANITAEADKTARPATPPHRAGRSGKGE